jgi:hypothetical protein
VLGRLGGDKQERLQRIEGWVEFFKLPAFGKMRLDGID